MTAHVSALLTTDGTWVTACTAHGLVSVWGNALGARIDAMGHAAAHHPPARC